MLRIPAVHWWTLTFILAYIICQLVFSYYFMSFINSRCDGRNFADLPNESPQALSSLEGTSNYINYLQDPVFISLSCVTLTALLACMVLTICVVYLRRKPNPKIKRRYIVNKNPSTSMTERPHAQQCEITIENCCNMNICETVSIYFTFLFANYQRYYWFICYNFIYISWYSQVFFLFQPCYEPPRLQKILSSRNEDKKMLLSNMEKVEDYWPITWNLNCSSNWNKRAVTSKKYSILFLLEGYFFQLEKKRNEYQNVSKTTMCWLWLKD